MATTVLEPGLDWMRTAPPWFSTVRRTVAKPTPQPPPRDPGIASPSRPVRAGDTREAVLHIVHHWQPSEPNRVASNTAPPDGVVSMAFNTRLATASTMADKSAVMHPSPQLTMSLTC